MSEKYFIHRRVAERVSVNFSWDEGTSADREFYKHHRDRFVEKNNILYALDVNKAYLQTLFEAALKIAGEIYVLALDLSGGDRRGAETIKHIAVFSRATWGSYEMNLYYISLFEKYIKDYGLASGRVDGEGRVRWLSDDEWYVEGTFEVYYRKQPYHFLQINDILYFLKPRVEIVQAMFFRCVQLAGSESALARALTTNNRLVERHKANFRQGAKFTKRANFNMYSRLFSEYLKRHHGLIEDGAIA